MHNQKKIIIVIPAFNNSKTLNSVFKRIPEQVLSVIDKFIIVNDGSKDNTQEIILNLSKEYKIHSIIHNSNRGYAQAQKSGFNQALKEGAEIIVLLHADGQYAPEELPILLEPLIRDEADIVQGSRILGGRALQGGMPIYKYIAIRCASIIENAIYGMDLREYHSGYMLYSAETLRKINFNRLSNTMYFDGEMLFNGHAKRLRIKSLPISTRYSNDIKSGVKPVGYVFDVAGILLRKLFGIYNH
jgi:glycosyltransferase involved in cell wall biosynthesis